MSKGTGIDRTFTFPSSPKFTIENNIYPLNTNFNPKTFFVRFLLIKNIWKSRNLTLGLIFWKTLRFCCSFSSHFEVQNFLTKRYMLLFRNGLRCKWKDLFTLSWFKGLFIASANSLSYTLPSQAPSVELRISSLMSKLSTKPTAFGRIAASAASKRFWSKNTSSAFKQENCSRKQRFARFGNHFFPGKG